MHLFTFRFTGQVGGGMGLCGLWVQGKRRGHGWGMEKGPERESICSFFHLLFHWFQIKMCCFYHLGRGMSWSSKGRDCSIFPKIFRPPTASPARWAARAHSRCGSGRGGPLPMLRIHAISAERSGIAIAEPSVLGDCGGGEWEWPVSTLILWERPSPLPTSPSLFQRSLWGARSQAWR